MRLSVIQRIFTGFIVVIISLMVISVLAILGLAKVDSNFSEVQEKANPSTKISSTLVINMVEIQKKMYEHYNSNSLEEAKAYEVELQQLKQDNLDLQVSLRQALEQIPNSQDVMLIVDQYQEEMVHNWEVLDSNVRVYSNTFVAFEKIAVHADLLNSLDLKMDEIANKISKLRIEDKQMLQVTQAQQSVTRGIAIAQIISKTTDNDELIESEDRFNAFLGEYGKIGFKMLSLGRKAPEAKPIITDLSFVVEQMSNSVTAEDGVGYLAKGKELTSQALLATRVNKLSESLNSSQDLLNNINQFTLDYSNFMSLEVKDAVSGVQNLIVYIGIFALLFGLIVAWLITRSISRPLVGVVKLLQDIADGELHERKLRIKNDELGRLSKAALQLNDSLRSVIETIRSQSKALRKSISSSKEVVVETHHSIDQQRSETDMVATAMTQMTATIHEVAQNAENAFKEMQQADEYALDSQKTVQENKIAANELHGQMKDAVAVINDLDGEVKNIEDIIQVIEGIAEQTNLLALNAAIEAARAGEQGRGFAVVADEVRSLAGKTRESTEEIKEKIGAMLAGSTKAVNVISSSQTQTQETVTRAEEVYEKIESFVKIIAHIKDLNMQIATASEEQTKTAEEINSNVMKIADLSEMTAEGAEKSSHQTTELEAAANQLDASIKRFNLD